MQVGEALPLHATILTVKQSPEPSDSAHLNNVGHGATMYCTLSGFLSHTTLARVLWSPPMSHDMSSLEPYHLKCSAFTSVSIVIPCATNTWFHTGKYPWNLETPPPWPLRSQSHLSCPTPSTVNLKAHNRHP